MVLLEGPEPMNKLRLNAPPSPNVRALETLREIIFRVGNRKFEQSDLLSNPPCTIFMLTALDDDLPETIAGQFVEKINAGDFHFCAKIGLPDKNSVHSAYEWSDPATNLSLWAIRQYDVAKDRFMTRYDMAFR